VLCAHLDIDGGAKQSGNAFRLTILDGSIALPTVKDSIDCCVELRDGVRWEGLAMLLVDVLVSCHLSSRRNFIEIRHLSAESSLLTSSLRSAAVSWLSSVALTCHKVSLDVIICTCHAERLPSSSNHPFRVRMPNGECRSPHHQTYSGSDDMNPVKKECRYVWQC
jgi:hypothetical protein